MLFQPIPMLVATYIQTNYQPYVQSSSKPKRKIPLALTNYNRSIKGIVPILKTITSENRQFREVEYQQQARAAQHYPHG
jgi:hypothetical protein